MNIEKTKDKLVTLVLCLVCLFLITKVLPYFVPFLNVILSALIPFILAFVITYVLEPAVEFLEKKLNFKRMSAFMIVYFVVMFVFIAMVLALIPEVVNQFNSMISFIINHQGEIQLKVSKYIEHSHINISEIVYKLKEWFFRYIFSLLNSGISLIKAFFSIVFMTPIFLFLLMKDYRSLKMKLKLRILEADRRDIIIIMRNIDVVLGKYVKGKLIDCFLVGTLVYIIFSILGLKFALLFSFIIGVTNLIPYVGPVIGAIPACLFALLQSFNIFIGVLIAIVFIQTLESVFLVPYITSKTWKYMRLLPFLFCL
jgi:predicted PurR-regulated permease PerM